MADITIGPGIERVVWIGPTTNVSTLAWYVTANVNNITRISANKLGYNLIRPGGVQTFTQFLGVTNGRPNVYEVNLKQAVTLDDSLVYVLGTAPAPTKGGGILEYDLDAWGDSIVRGDQLNVENNEPAGGASTARQTAMGVDANSGNHVAVQLAAAMLNAAFGPDLHFNATPFGYPSKTWSWFKRNHEGGDYATRDISGKALVFAFGQFFANDPANADQPTDATDASSIKALAKEQLLKMKQFSSKIKVIPVLPLNRDNYPQYLNFKVARSQYEDAVLADAASWADEVVDLRSQPVGSDIAPVAVRNDSPINDLFWDTAGHPRNVGQAQMAIAYAQAVCRSLGRTLPAYGNGTRPAARPAISLVVSPATGTASAPRTAKLTTSATYSQLRLFQANSQGLTYAPTLVATVSGADSLSFTAASSASYYVELTLPDGSLRYSLPVAVSVTAGSGVVRQVLDFDRHKKYLTKQGDGTMLKTDGPDDGWRGQTTAYQCFGPDGAVGSGFDFIMPAPFGNGAGFTIGLSADKVDISGSAKEISTMEKGCFYADDDKAFIFYAPGYVVTPASGQLPRPATGNQIDVHVASDGYYFTDVTAQTLLFHIATNGSPTGYTHYITAAAGTTNYSRIPVVTGYSTQFMPAF